MNEGFKQLVKVEILIRVSFIIELRGGGAELLVKHSGSFMIIFSELYIHLELRKKCLPPPLHYYSVTRQHVDYVHDIIYQLYSSVEKMLFYSTNGECFFI